MGESNLDFFDATESNILLIFLCKFQLSPKSELLCEKNNHKIQVQDASSRAVQCPSVGLLQVHKQCVMQYLCTYVLFFVYIQTMALVTTKQLKKTGQTYHQFKVSLNYQVYVNDLNEDSNSHYEKVNIFYCSVIEIQK